MQQLHKNSHFDHLTMFIKVLLILKRLVILHCILRVEQKRIGNGYFTLQNVNAHMQDSTALYSKCYC